MCANENVYLGKLCAQTNYIFSKMCANVLQPLKYVTERRAVLLLEHTFQLLKIELHSGERKIVLKNHLKTKY